MKVLLDIEDDKADALLAVLRDLPYLNIEKITTGKAGLLEELKESVQEVNLAKKGKIKLQTMEELAAELGLSK